jgi:hypothetical protein
MEGRTVVIRALLLVLGLFHLANGVMMLFAPAPWFATVPGVSMTGPFNHHFVQDVGLAFIASGAGLGLSARVRPHAGLLAAAGATWPILHALLHVWGWFTGTMADAHIIATEALGVVAPAALGGVLAWLRIRGEN